MAIFGEIYCCEFHFPWITLPKDCNRSSERSARNVEERNSKCSHISHSLLSKDQLQHAGPYHVTGWLGDLNNRIQGIKTQCLEEALSTRTFTGCSMAKISCYKPTYKSNVDSNNYDTSCKIRVPARTDRILFKVEHDHGIDAILNSYESIDYIKSSDHKPVKAHLCLKLNSHSDLYRSTTLI
nr:PREDICTED: type IV inositol polyphosphate 5-phosphatase 11-like [Musa acuminata subsp. malaccensis]